MSAVEWSKRMQIGEVPIDSLTFDEAIDAIDALV